MANERVQCNKCNKSYARKQHLVRHMTVDHEIDKSKYHVCHYAHCNTVFETDEAFNKHCKDYHNTEAMQCDICGKTVSNKHKLKLHKNVFHGKMTKTFKCNICGKSFNYKANRNLHEGQCKGNEDQYENVQCDKCNKTFTNAAHLKRHVTFMHDAPKKFRCEVCDEAFKTKVMLRNHKSNSHIHKYKCVQCERIFNLRITLETHINDDHPKQHRCLLCKKPFTEVDNLQKHLLTFHMKMMDNF